MAQEQEKNKENMQNKILLEQAGQFANSPLADPSNQQPPTE